MPKGRRKADPSQVARKRAKYKRSLQRAVDGGSNPFHKIVTKNVRNSVIGQKTKGAIRRPGHSINRGIEKRKKTLLREYEAVEDNQLNTIIDRRDETLLDKATAKASNDENGSKLNSVDKKKQRIDSKRMQKETAMKIASEKQRIESMMSQIRSQRQSSSMKRGRRGAQRFNLESNDNDESLRLTHGGKEIGEYAFDTSRIDVLTKMEEDRRRKEGGDDELPYLSSLDKSKMMQWMSKGKSLDDIKKEMNIPLGRHSKKTRPQELREKMVTSRYYQCLRQLESEQVSGSTNDLDSQFGKIERLLNLSSAKNNSEEGSKIDQTPQSKRRRTTKESSKKEFSLDGIDFGSSKKHGKLMGKDDEYVDDQTLAELDQAQKQLEMGLKARASNNLLTAADKAKAVFLNLQYLEKKRKRGGNVEDGMDSDIDSSGDESLNDDIPRSEEMLQQRIDEVEKDSSLTKKEKRKEIRRLKSEFEKQQRKQSGKKRRSVSEFVASEMGVKTSELSSKNGSSLDVNGFVNDESDQDESEDMEDVFARLQKGERIDWNETERKSDSERSLVSDDESSDVDDGIQQSNPNTIIDENESSSDYSDIEIEDFADEHDREVYASAAAISGRMGSMEMGGEDDEDLGYEIADEFMPRLKPKMKKMKKKGRDSKTHKSDPSEMISDDSDSEFLSSSSMNTDDDESDYLEGAELNADGLGDDSLLHSEQISETLAKELRRSRKRKAMHDSTEDWDEYSRRISTKKKAINGNNQKNGHTDDSWDELKIVDRCDFIGEGLESVPFVMSVPESMSDFHSLLNDKSPAQQITILKRLRSCNSVHLQPHSDESRMLSDDNRGSTEKLYDYCLARFKWLCSEASSTGASSISSEWMSNVDVMSRVIFALSHDLPKYAYQSHSSRLKNINDYLHRYYNPKLNERFLKVDDESSNDIANGEGGGRRRTGQVSTMPSAYALFYLQLCHRIFPCGSKRFDSLNSCLTLILCKCVSEVPVNGMRDVLAYLFCVTLLVDIAKQSARTPVDDQGAAPKTSRYIPEVVNGLNNLLRAGFASVLASKKSGITESKKKKSKKNGASNDGGNKDYDLSRLRESDALNLLFNQQSATDFFSCLIDRKSDGETEIPPVSLSLLFETANDSLLFKDEESRLEIAESLLYSTLSLIQQASDVWRGFLAYTEVFTPVLSVLIDERVRSMFCLNQSRHTIKCNLNGIYSECVRSIRAKMAIQSVSRKPLQLIRKAVPLLMYDPEFDPDVKPSFLRLGVRNERALEKKQARILKKAQRRQKKALMREISKDTAFIMNEKTKRRMEGEARLKAKWVDEYRHLMEQARDTNAFQMVGKKLRKRMIKDGIIKGFKRIRESSQKAYGCRSFAMLSGHTYNEFVRRRSEFHLPSPVASIEIAELDSHIKHLSLIKDWFAAALTSTQDNDEMVDQRNSSLIGVDELVEKLEEQELELASGKNRRNLSRSDRVMNEEERKEVVTKEELNDEVTAILGGLTIEDMIREDHPDELDAENQYISDPNPLTILRAKYLFAHWSKVNTNEGYIDDESAEWDALHICAMNPHLTGMREWLLRESSVDPSNNVALSHAIIHENITGNQDIIG